MSGITLICENRKFNTDDSIVLRKRQNHWNDLNVTAEITIPFNSESKTKLKAQIDIPTLDSVVEYGAIYDMYVKKDGCLIRLKANELAFAEFGRKISTPTLKTISLYETVDHFCAIKSVITPKFKLCMTSLKVHKKNLLHITLESKLDCPFYRASEKQLVFKIRNHEDIYHYVFEKTYPVSVKRNKLSCDVNLSDMTASFNLPIFDWLIVDTFVRLRLNNQSVDVHVGNVGRKLKKPICLLTDYGVTAFKLYANAMDSLTIQQELVPNLCSIQPIDEHTVSLTQSNAHFTVEDIVFTRQTEKGWYKGVLQSIVRHIQPRANGSNGCIVQLNGLSMPLDNSHILLKLNMHNQILYCTLPEEAQKKLKFILCHGKDSKSNSGEKRQSNAQIAVNVRVAVLGSCYTRGAFNSSDYFNPDYKKEYEVAYTQFHSAIPSLVSEPVAFQKTYYQHCNDKEFEFIKTDYEKTFFAKLEAAAPDYLIIDLYADAVRNLILIDERKIITEVPNTRKSVYLGDILKNVQIITQDDVPRFMNIWNSSLRIFSKRLLNVVSSNQIILHKIRMTDRYYDKEQVVKTFNKIGQPSYIRRTNNLLEVMEEKLIRYLNISKVVDITECGYIGDTNHPAGRSPNHYESAYYQRFLQELSNIVIQDSKVKQFVIS